MIFPSNRVRIMVATKPIDFTKGHDSLAAMVKNELRQDAFTGTVFVFRAMKADRLKLLYWDGTGLVPLGDAGIACRAMDGLQAAGRTYVRMARRDGRADAGEPCPIRGAICWARLATGSGH